MNKKTRVKALPPLSCRGPRPVMDIARGDEFKEYPSVIIVRRDDGRSAFVRYYYDDCLGGGGNDRRNFPITHTHTGFPRPAPGDVPMPDNTSDFYAYTSSSL